MARQLRWSPGAVEDVEAIAQYIERDSSYYAQSVVSRIGLLADSIPDQPESGRVVTVIHGSRQLEPLVGRIHSVQEI
jgi:plasmid stabilization system protein ParE